MSEMKQSQTVPAFLSKLWTLVEDQDTEHLITWSQEGNSFLVLDEQRFSKEILPKFFKHNNMASFIRQLNMYGFRKVMHIDSGIVKQEKDGPVEFQHPYFKHGRDDLLENIKRKVSNARPEDSRIRQEDLSKILASVQSVHSKQGSIDARLATLKRENEALWREIADLRQKHVHQQQLIKKLIQFIVTLVQNNRLLNLKRKRPILMTNVGTKSKYIHQIYDDTPSSSSLQGVKTSEGSDDVIICDLKENQDVPAESPSPVQQSEVDMVELQLDGPALLPLDAQLSSSPLDDSRASRALSSSMSDDNRASSNRVVSSSMSDDNRASSNRAVSSALQVNKPSGLSLDDPLKMMDSILRENGAISQNINLLGRVELMDYLDSIDCSLEDFQAMLCGKQFGSDAEGLEESSSSKDDPAHIHRGNTDDKDSDKQLVQYTCCPLLALLDGCSAAPDLDPASSSAVSVEAEPTSDLLDSLEVQRPPRSSMIRLEPLTEAQASEETLFQLCELSPDGEDNNAV